MTLIEKSEIILGNVPWGDDTANDLNSFFSNTVSNFNTPEYSNCELLCNNTNDPILKYVIKYKNHPSILAIGEVYNQHRRLSFFFPKINKTKKPRGKI